MVRRNYTLTESERNALNRAANILEVNQSDLAKLASVSQAWLSVTLSGKRAKREVENISRLAHALLGRLPAAGAWLESKRDEADEITKTLKKLASVSEVASTKFISPPGRVVPASAENYVRRSVDKVIDECLESGNLSMFVVGPFQAGKTSLLLRLRDEAKRRGFETAYFSCKSLAKPRFFSDSASVFRLRAEQVDKGTEGGKEIETFFRSLKDKLTNEWELSPSPQLDEADFPTWAEKLLKFGPDQQALVVLDDLGYLSPLLRHRISSDIRIVKNTNSFVSFARGLVEVCPISLEGKREVGKLQPTVLISSMSPTTSISSLSPSLSTSSFSPDKQHLAIDNADWWFSEDQLKTLFRCLNVHLSDEHFASIYEQYGGQPFFSHLVAVNTDSHVKSDFKDHLKQLELQWSAFEQHKNLIRVTLVEAAFILAFEDEGLMERLTLADLLERLQRHYVTLTKIIGISGGSSDISEGSEALLSFLAARKIIRMKASGEIELSCAWYREIACGLGEDLKEKRIVLKFDV
jgi:transcriptional regulator with XRE-family HTH domain